MQGKNRSGHSKNNSKNSNRSWTPIENTKTSREAESQGSTMTSNEQKSKLESQSETEDDINTTNTPIIRTSKLKHLRKKVKNEKLLKSLIKVLEKKVRNKKILEVLVEITILD